MTNEQKLSAVRRLFTTLQAETISRYSKAGIFADIERERIELSLALGENNAKMLGVTKPEEAFTIPSAIVDCALWDISSNGNCLKAISSGCKLAAMCKKLEAPSPCRMYCLSAIEGMIKALKPAALFTVKSTLWSGTNCTIVVTW